MTTKETVLQRLIDLKLVADRNDGERWMLEGSIPSFGYITATQLIIEDKVDALLDERLQVVMLNTSLLRHSLRRVKLTSY